MMHADDDVMEGWADEMQAQSIDNDNDEDDEDDDISDSEDDASDASEDAISVVARLAVDEATDAAIRQSQSSPCASWANTSADVNDGDGQVSPEARSLPRHSDQSDSDEDEEAWPDCPRPSTSLLANQTPSDQSGDDDDEAEVTSWSPTTLTCPSALSPALQPWAPPLTAPADCPNCLVVSITLTDSCFLSL